MSPNPILFKLSAEVTKREAHDLFKSGQISAGEYSSILIAGRDLNRIADQQMMVLAPRPRVRGASYDERRF